MVKQGELRKYICISVRAISSLFEWRKIIKSELKDLLISGTNENRRIKLERKMAKLEKKIVVDAQRVPF
jgi:hypothetical protein